MDFRLLGPIEVRVQGRPVAIPGGRQRALLALLLLRAGEPVARDRVIEDLWGERPPDGAVKTVQAVVSRLRRALGGEASRVVTSAAGYRLRVEPDELDVGRFERLADEGRRALAAGRPERAAARLRAALDEWRGPPLADMAFEPFAQPEIARLEELRASALEDRIEADLALGRGAELVGELEALVDREPHRERPRGQLMLALYRAGRQAEALEAYREAVRTLGNELGLRPGTELERLQRAIVAHDPALLRRTATEAPAAVERRVATATILFAETARPDAEAARRLRDVLAAHGGAAVKALGDRLLAAFDASGNALACAVEMQRAIDRHAQGRSGAPGMRIGISAGDVAWEGDDPFGAAVAEAEALCAAAPPLGILVADAVRLLAGSRAQVAFEDADEVVVPGGEPPLRAWAVGWTAERSVAVPLAAPLAIDPSAAFAGREAELAGLRKAWSDAVSARGRGVLVSGEPGIGKTRLAAELTRYVREREGIALYGRCDDGLSAPAQPFAEALGAYAAACPIDELRVQLGSHAGQLAKLLPELADRIPGAAEPAPAEPELERLRTFEAVAALLRTAGDMSAVLLVLDDLHWADDFSLLLLRHLLRADTSRRLLVLATYRDTEPSASPLLAEVVTGLARHPDVERIELGSLAERDIATILAHAGRESSLAGRVWTATEGNPFFVGEVVAALGEDGDPDAALTPRVRDVVRWRLARLPSGTADVLATAAVAGAEFEADVVAAAQDVELGPALDAIGAAERARLLRPAGVVGRFGFAHALVRQAILGDLPDGTRARVHARIAHALERVATTRAVPAGELATHFAAAGTLVDAGQVVRYAREAGDGAAARLAFDVAAQHYESAARAHERLPDPPAGERLDLDLALGRALVLAGNHRADPFLRAIAAAAEAAGDGARMADALLTIRLEYTDFLEEDAEMVALLRRALALLPPGDSAITARLEAFLAQEAFSSVPDHERHQMVGRALAMARRVGDPRALASVLTSHSWIVAGPASLPQRLAIGDELVARACCPSHSAYGRSAARPTDSWRSSSSATSRPPTTRWPRRTRRHGRRSRSGPRTTWTRRERFSRDD